VGHCFAGQRPSHNVLWSQYGLISMPFRIPSPQVLKFFLAQRVAAWMGRRRRMDAGLGDPALSPSARHFADYETAPLKLRFVAQQQVDAKKWQALARAKLAELCGYAPSTGVPEALRDDVFALANGMSRRRIYLKPRPGVVIPIHLVERSGRPRPSSVMICLQGTNSGAHLSWGEVRFAADIEKRSDGYDFAIQAAERGYLAVAIEQSCFGERTERMISPRSAAPCVDATMHALLLGRSLLGERCSDVSAVIDWLTASAADLAVDAGEIHAMGHSSGGSIALFTGALDERIGAVLACGCIGFIRETIGRRRDDQGQNVVPGMLQWMELADVVGLLAPRPLVTVAGTDDHIWPAKGAIAVIQEAKNIYAKLDANDLIACVSEPGGHRFRPAASWSSFQAVLERKPRAGTPPALLRDP